MIFYLVCQASKCWIYRYWYRLCVRYVFCQTPEWAEIYIRMWRIWAVEIQRQMKAAENSTLFLRTACSCCMQLHFGAGACSMRPMAACAYGEQDAPGILQRWRLVPLFPTVWRLISSPVKGWSLCSWLVELFLQWSEHSLPDGSGWLLMQG